MDLKYGAPCVKWRSNGRNGQPVIESTTFANYTGSTGWWSQNLFPTWITPQSGGTMLFVGLCKNGQGSPFNVGDDHIGYSGTLYMSLFVGPNNRFQYYVGDGNWFIMFITFKPSTGKVRFRVHVDKATSDYIPAEKNYVQNFYQTNWQNGSNWTYNKGWPNWTNAFGPDPAITTPNAPTAWNGQIGELHFWNCYMDLSMEESFFATMKTKWNIT